MLREVIKITVLSTLLLLLSVLEHSTVAAADEDPSVVVKRLYSWVYVPIKEDHIKLPNGEIVRGPLYDLADDEAGRNLYWQKFHENEQDFAPELRHLLRAIEQTGYEVRHGTRKEWCWDNEPLTWSEPGVMVRPLRIVTTSRLRTSATVSVKTTSYCLGRGIAVNPQSWNVNLVQRGGRWQIANLHFANNRNDVLDRLNSIDELRNLAKKYP